MCTMSQPASASASAAVWPMPRVVPVTHATWPSRRKLSRTPGTGRGYHRPVPELFAYGTLQQSNVQLALFGRTLDGRADVLPGYAISPLVITDPDVIATSGSALHTVARETGDPLDEIPGTALSVTRGRARSRRCVRGGGRAARDASGLPRACAAFVYVGS